MIPIRTAVTLVVLAFSGNSQNQPPSANPVFQAMVKDAKARVQEVSASQLKDWLGSSEKVVLIDVREDSEWQSGRVAGAIHIGRGVLERDIEAAVRDHSIRVVVYCQGGARSALAADTLQKMGYTNVFSLAGGLQAYKAAGLPMQN